MRSVNPIGVTGAARARARRQAREAAAAVQPSHIHLPSMHVRHKGGGYDYDEDLHIEAGGRVRRVIRLAAFEDHAPAFIRETRHEIAPEEWEGVLASLAVLLEEGNPEAEEVMRERALREFQRQLRIIAGEEDWCRGCGCSETRACSGGCIWVTENLCSRCA